VSNKEEIMKNVGTGDSQARWVLGFSLFVLSYFSAGIPHWVFLVLGIVMVLTAFVRFCPVWFGLKINTHSSRK
jgi:hypothetical protein